MKYFSNPIFSSRRATLMTYIPDTSICNSQGVYDLADKIFQNINNSPQKDVQGSPEAEYLGYLSVGRDLNTYCVEKITSYLERINLRLQTQDGIDAYLRVSESRRRIFRPPPGSMDPKNGLAEFDMTLPYADALDKDAKKVVMTETGEIKEVEELDGEKEELPPKYSRFSSEGCPWAASR